MDIYKVELNEREYRDILESRYYHQHKYIALLPGGLLILAVTLFILIDWLTGGNVTWAWLGTIPVIPAMVIYVQGLERAAKYIKSEIAWYKLHETTEI